MSPSEFVTKMSLPDISAATERLMRTSQLVKSSYPAASAMCATASALAFMSSRWELMMKFWPMKTSAAPMMRKLSSTISAVERKFRKYMLFILRSRGLRSR